MTCERFIGWDIGGAHLKVAAIDRNGAILSAEQYPTPIWRGLEHLDSQLENISSLLHGTGVRHAITTTAELSDIFPDRNSGIRTISECLQNFIPAGQYHFYSGPGGWVTPGEAERFSRQISSANWHATASFVARQIGEGILLDIGSTTTDIIHLCNGSVQYQGYTDYERLSTGELIYTGVIRTPVMAVTDGLEIDGKWQPLVAEQFATMGDIYRLGGDLDENDDMMQTSDGASKSRPASARRLARMFGIDLENDEILEKWTEIAGRIAEQHRLKIRKIVEQKLATISNDEKVSIIGAGAGSFLAARIAEELGCNYMEFSSLPEISFPDRKQVSRIAPAIAVAHLMRMNS